MSPFGWTDWAKRSTQEYKFPSRRRRAKWAAEAQFHRVLQTLHTGSIAIDCGANVGSITQRLAASGATVHAFEPDPLAFATLQSATGSFPNVHPINKAVGSRDGQATLYRHRFFADDPIAYTQSSSLHPGKENLALHKTFEVEQIDLAAFVQSMPRRVDLLKIDVEGAEVDILEKMLDTKAIDLVDHVFVETHEKQIPDLWHRIADLRARLAAKKGNHVNLDWR